MPLVVDKQSRVIHPVRGMQRLRRLPPRNKRAPGSLKNGAQVGIGLAVLRRYVVPRLEKKNAQTTPAQLPGGGPSITAGPDDHHVVASLIGHEGNLLTTVERSLRFRLQQMDFFIRQPDVQRRAIGSQVSRIAARPNRMNNT
jgi:hypothetical protein